VLIIEAFILMVGGDRHGGYEPTIKQQQFPLGKVAVEFPFPGISGNWIPHQDTVRGSIDQFDAVVLIYLTRTTLREWVRELARGAGIPAYTCGRQDRGAVMHAIAMAIKKALATERE
jgi:hypothetical protein